MNDRNVIFLNKLFIIMNTLINFSIIQKKSNKYIVFTTHYGLY